LPSAEAHSGAQRNHTRFAACRRFSRDLEQASTLNEKSTDVYLGKHMINSRTEPPMQSDGAAMRLVCDSGKCGADHGRKDKVFT
jgi:hypothetical protein